MSMTTTDRAGSKPAAGAISRCRRPVTKALLSAILGTILIETGVWLHAEPLPKKAADFFRTTNIYSIHLQFTADEWRKMEPEGGQGGFFGGPRGGGPGGGPDSDRRGGGPGGFGPGMFLAPAFQKAAAAKEDASLSAAEFSAIGEKWFAAWDKDKQGKLTQDQISAGLNSVIEPPDFGGGGPGRGPGGPRGGGGGLNLQGPEGKRNGLASAAGIEFKYVHASLEIDGESYKDVAVRYKGNGTWMNSQGTIKRSLKVDINKYDKDQKIAGQTTLNLHNNVTDASWMNEVLSYRLFRDAGVPAPHSAYARVYVTVPGQHDHKYFGLYSIIEAPDKHFASKTFKAKDGAIFKPVTPNLFADLGNDWARYNQTYDPKGEVTAAQKQRVMDFSKLVSNANDAEFAARLPDFLDLDEFAGFIGIEAWLATMDSILAMGQNYYVYLHPETHKFQFLPWDLDHSFGQFPMVGSQEERENLSLMHPWRGENRFLERVFKVEAFQRIYKTKMGTLSHNILKPDRFAAQVDELAAALRPAVKEESAGKLARFDKVVAGKSVSGGGMGGPPRDDEENDERPGGFGGFGQAVKPIKTFAVARARSVTDQLSGASQGLTMEEGFGFSGPGRGPGRRGGPGGGPAGGRREGPEGFGPGMMFAGTLMNAFDTDKNKEISHAEFTAGFSRWFMSWTGNKGDRLTPDQLREGINKDLAPRFDGPPPF